MYLSFSASYNEIVPRIYLGNLSAATSNELLQKNAITHVLSVCNDHPSKANDAKHLTIGVEDTEYTDLLIHLPKACAWIQAALDTSGRVLVHCMMGVSRSATVVAAYLMMSRQISASAALRLIKQKRPQIHPNYGFLKQLDVWAECAYNLSPTNTVYTSWKQKQNKTITGFLNYVHDTIPIIKDQLYLSSDFPADVKQGDYLLKEWGITHVLSISPSKIAQPVLSSVTHLHVNAGYDSRPDLLLALPDACRFIKNAVESKGLVLVHCSRECRACIVVGAYLMKSRHATLLEAQSVLEDALPLFSAPAAFIRHLEAFASCECNPKAEHPVIKTWSGSPPAPKQNERSKTNMTSVSTMSATASALLSETGIDLGAFGDTLAAIQTASLIIRA